MVTESVNIDLDQSEDNMKVVEMWKFYSHYRKKCTKCNFRCFIVCNSGV